MPAPGHLAGQGLEVSLLGHGPSADRLPSPTPQSQYIFLHGCLLSRILEGAPAPLSTCSSGNLVRWGAGSPSLPPTGCQLRPCRAEETGSGSWAASGTPDMARAPPRPQPIRVRSFARACSERAADGNAGLLGEHEVAAGRAARRRGVPSCHHFCGLSHGAPLPVTLPSYRSRPSRTRWALRCPLLAVGRTARPPVSASGLAGEPGIGCRPGWDLWRPHPHPRPADGCCHERSPPAEDSPAADMPEAWLFPVRPCPWAVGASWSGAGGLGVLELRRAGDTLCSAGRALWPRSRHADRGPQKSGSWCGSTGLACWSPCACQTPGRR